MIVEKDYINVPKDFLISCELIGIMVPAFLQLIIDHFRYAYIFMHDKSEYDMATKAFLEAESLLEKEKPKHARNLSRSDADHFLKLTQQVLKITMNRNYSYSSRRNKVKAIAGKMLQICSKELDTKRSIYLNEEIKLQLNDDFLLTALIHDCTPTELLNAMMKRVSLAEFTARYDLKQEEYNPALSFFVRVMDGYGDIQDKAYLDSPAFKEHFLWDLQEFRTRYFFYRNLEDRVEIYRERLEENHKRINTPFFDHD